MWVTKLSFVSTTLGNLYEVIITCAATLEVKGITRKMGLVRRS
jgi:hypothetical protein